MNTRLLILTVIGFLFLILTPMVSLASDLPKLEKSLKQARAYTKGNTLIVTTGKIERCWEWTGKGFLTGHIKNQQGQILATGLGKNADWNLGDLGLGKLISLRAFKDDDEHFTSQHLAVEAEIEYANLHLKYVIWAYPDAPGLRTQLWLKTPEGLILKNKSLNPGISETIDLTNAPEEVTTFGYQAGLKADVEPYEILTKEKISEKGGSNIASGFIVKNKHNGLVLIKESHKHTHMDKELETGGFRRQDNNVSVSGLGLTPKDIVSNQYRFCWANWMVVFEGSEIDAQLAIKRFDRQRFPVHPERDVFIMANTWGSEDAFDQCTYKAREENVLKEINVCAELGIDLLQIDDGWQIREGEDSWLPSEKGPTEPYIEGDLPKLIDGTTMPECYEVYPTGFRNVKKHAKKAGITLGLWHAWTAPLSALESNYDDGDFKAYKLDFATLERKEALDGLYYKARDLIKYSDYSTVVNWDVTEMEARMGFYFGRDCGNLYLANRKASTVRERVQYNPWQVLRDAWELANFMNLNKIQITYQNKDLTPPGAKTDALKYTHAYNFAITLMSSPIFFTELQYLTLEARTELKPIITKYKSEREEMYQGYVFAIGNKPDNESWTGLQNHNPETGDGYLTVFRELNNQEASSVIALHFLKPGTKLKITNIITGENSLKILNENSEINFQIPQAPGFLFLKYKQD